MPFLKNIIFALCLTINLGNENHKIYIKPSTYLMPEAVFTNQANLDLVRKNKLMRINPPCIRIFSNETREISKKQYQVNILLPDVACWLEKMTSDRKRNSLGQKSWDIRFRIVKENKLVSPFPETLACRNYKN